MAVEPVLEEEEPVEPFFPAVPPPVTQAVPATPPPGVPSADEGADGVYSSSSSPMYPVILERPVFILMSYATCSVWALLVMMLADRTCA